MPSNRTTTMSYNDATTCPAELAATDAWKQQSSRRQNSTVVFSGMREAVSKKRLLSERSDSSVNSESTARTVGLDDSDRTCQQEEPRHERRIEFAMQNNTCISIMSRHDYSDEEFDACFYQEDEYSVITKECVKTIKKMQAGGGEGFKNQKYCSRGLESHTSRGSASKSYNRRVAFDAVLDEQYDQLQLGVIDEDAIAYQYSQVSSSCQLWASTVGLQDQRSAE